MKAAITATSVRLLIVDQSDTDRFTLRDAQQGDHPPDNQSVWLYATLEHTYDDEATVRADAWVTWDCWILIGVDGVRLNLKDEIRAARRRQLRGTANSRATRAVTFVLR